jgi:kynureninase
LLPALHPRKEKSGYNRGMVLPSLTQDDALQRDAQDELAAFRERFYFEEAPPGSPCLIYLDGNSLGRLPLQTALAMEEVISNQWGRQLIRSWGQHWLAAPVRAGEAIAGLVGAAPGQVIVCDSTSINLYKLAMAALALRPGCSAIVSDQLNFPSDLYILQGCLETTFAGRASQPGSSQSLPELRLAPPAPGSGGSLPDLDALLAAIDEQVALVSLSQVAFKSGYLYDVAEITRQAHAAGALVLWDLSHSAGALPIELDAWDVDFAVGCTYKYLNGGPGAPAFLYVNRRLQDSAVSPIRGWFGQDQPFRFDLQYTPAPGIQRFQTGTPPVLSLLALEQGLAILPEAGLERIRRKSLAQTSYLIELFDARLRPLGFELGTPRDPAQRGSHVSLRHPEGYRINRALIEELAVLPDFREPDNLRLGIAPLYTSFLDIWEAVGRIAQVVEERRYLNYPETRLSVT